MADTPAVTSPKYVQVDENNYVNVVKSTLTDSDDATKWIKLFIPSAFQTDFGKFFDKYQVDPNTKALIPRPGADNPSIDTVQQSLKDTNAELVAVKQANSDLGDKLTAANTTITDLQTKYKQDSDTTTEAILELSDQVLSAVPAGSSTTPASDTTTPAGGGK
ncbi:hypothetical protein HC026_02050 [Lactobacillus sp. LC28-10]|uniref:Uncharacterized protein n=1 Tax=Secundilactobacillus angelensis TaxID=2722706 RepID=A0ABX1KUT5_9LACO|nr:hypothetical protein [Secundilactobacillus angelensis]MCH5461490.1 hypothetical protein [Secundilactobacillus angelensis]NLR17697.1 hypothetical protein [Secundilactobacillus angelensis]